MKLGLIRGLTFRPNRHEKQELERQLRAALEFRMAQLMLALQVLFWLGFMGDTKENLERDGLRASFLQARMFGWLECRAGCWYVSIAGILALREFDKVLAHHMIEVAKIEAWQEFARQTKAARLESQAKAA
jgi:hypothetical protein